MVNLYHRKHEIAIDLTGIERPKTIQIAYSGKMQAESMLADDWIIFCNDTKIICFSLSNNPTIPELIMRYTGLIRIKGATIIDSILTKHSANVSLEDIDYWENMVVDFDKNTQYWEGLDSVHQSENIIISTIVKNNLLTNPDEFYFADGTPYQGEYHQHGDGQAMTGGEHSQDSEHIYRMDSKWLVYDPREKMSEERKARLDSVKSRVIPQTRKFTKSDTKKAKGISRQIDAPRKTVSPTRVQRTVKTIKGY